jgi:hypothetical protein
MLPPRIVLCRSNLVVILLAARQKPASLMMKRSLGHTEVYGTQATVNPVKCEPVT